MLTKDEIKEFIDAGVVVVPNVLNNDEINDIINDWDKTLLKYGINSDNLDETAHNLGKLSSTNGAGGIVDLFYPSWRLNIATNSKIFNIVSTLWEYTYACNHELFQHPFGDFDPKKGVIYMNRVCYRIPDNICNKYSRKKRKLQRCLAPHCM